MSYSKLHLDPDEKIILEVRKHWIVFFGHGMFLLFIAILPLVVFAVVKGFFPSFFNIDFGGNTSALFLFIYTLWVLFLWILFFLDWTKYYLDVWYVTEKRIIAVDQKKIFDREVSNLRFDKIQDITIDVHGFVSTMLNFGNIRVQTASENSQEFRINTVRNPEHVKKVIFGQQNIINHKIHVSP
jgi:hypothetical protein